MAHTPLLYKNTALSGTAYVNLPIKKGTLGQQIAWLDATSSATLTIELTNYDADDAPLATAGAANVWKDSGVSVTGPAGSAIGATVLNIENVRQKRARLKIVTAATTNIEIIDGANYL
jgi:hypothetical protein